MLTLKARAVGNSTGVTFPKEVTDRLKIKNGDPLYLTESPDGYRITAYDPEFERQMGVAEKVMRRYKEALRQLAK
jgi:putative addiction module antidote